MITRRQIIRFDEDKCDGCGLCAAACEEGAIRINDGKARLVSEQYCDGLGACIGECPQGAIVLEDRDAAEFDARAVERHLASTGAHARHGERTQPSALTNWPVQMRLMSVRAPHLRGARLMIAADCVPFAFADFHRRLLRGRTLMVGCPKLDDVELYRAKLRQVFEQNDVDSVEVAYMEVPCCFGLVHVVRQALADSGKPMPVTLTKVSIGGRVCEADEAPAGTAEPSRIRPE